MDNEFLKFIFNRVSTRKYQNLVVEEEKITLLLKAAMSAPSAMNFQPWGFIVVNEKYLLNKLAENLPNATMLSQVNVAIVVCGDLSKAGEGELKEYWIQDCSAATQNILLSAEILDLGAVWTGVYPRQERILKVKEILQLPEFIVPLNIIPIGYPIRESKPKEKFNSSNIYLNSWTNKKIK